MLDAATAHVSVLILRVALPPSYSTLVDPHTKASHAFSARLGARYMRLAQPAMHPGDNLLKLAKPARCRRYSADGPSAADARAGTLISNGFGSTRAQDPTRRRGGIPKRIRVGLCLGASLCSLEPFADCGLRACDLEENRLLQIEPFAVDSAVSSPQYAL